jgi:hypothetical protein
LVQGLDVQTIRIDAYWLVSLRARARQLQMIPLLFVGNPAYQYHAIAGNGNGWP